MHLLLGQLIYTSFIGSGFRVLASKCVPQEIQQAFVQQVVSCYWDSYNPPLSGYRAVYLHQITPNRTLFGWLYNDGADDVGRNNVPYFICYYLAESLFEFQLANIFTCLENGPVALLDRCSHIPTLETKEIADLWSYQAARPGVTIPFRVRQQSYANLQQGKLLHLFMPVYEQEMVIDLSGQTYEQQIANFSIYKRYIIEGVGVNIAELKNKTAIAQSNTIKLYQNPQSKLPRSKQLFVNTIAQHYINIQAHQRFQRLQQGLLPRNNCVEPIKAWLDQQINNIAAKNSDSWKNLPPKTSFSQLSLDINSRNSSNFSSVSAYKNSQLLLKISIAVTILALAASIYGILQVGTKSHVIPQKRSFSFYKNLTKQVLSDEKLIPTVLEVANQTKVLRLVTNASEGISDAATSEVTEQTSINSIFLSAVNLLPLYSKTKQAFVSSFNYQLPGSQR